MGLLGKNSTGLESSTRVPYFEGLPLRKSLREV